MNDINQPVKGTMEISKLQQAQEIIICMFEQNEFPKRILDNWENPLYPKGYGLNNGLERIWFIEEAGKIVGRDLFINTRLDEIKQDWDKDKYYEVKPCKHWTDGKKCPICSQKLNNDLKSKSEELK